MNNGTFWAIERWINLAGWGVKKEDDKFPEPWNWDERLKHADRLADWVCQQPQEREHPHD